MLPSERLKWLHELARETRERERDLLDLEALRQANEALAAIVRSHRLEELRWWMMTDAEIADQVEEEARYQADIDDYRNEDWTA